MPKYNVVLQFGGTGTTKEVEYRTNWNPEKVDTEEVARACAAEHTVAGGRNPDGTYKKPCLGISAILLEEPATATA